MRAYHQWGLGSIPKLDVICLLSFSVLSSEKFFPGYSGFPLTSRTNILLDLVSHISDSALEALVESSFPFPYQTNFSYRVIYVCSGMHVICCMFNFSYVNVTECPAKSKC